MEVSVEKKGFRSVQELALNSENVTPNEYIYEGGVELYDALPFSESNLHITVIDIGNLTSPSTAIAQQELQKLQSALDSCGFFMVSFSLFIYLFMHACCLHFLKEFIIHTQE